MSEFPPYTPDIENPYPASRLHISNFRYETPLNIMRAQEAIRFDRNRESEYIVSKPYSCTFDVDGRRTRLTVPQGMLTDLTSVPFFARFIVERVGDHLEAAIIHDFLFIAWRDLQGCAPTNDKFQFANRVMWEAMVAAKVPLYRRCLIYWAVSSCFGWKAFRRCNKGPRYVIV